MSSDQVDEQEVKHRSLIKSEPAEHDPGSSPLTCPLFLLPWLVFKEESTKGVKKARTSDVTCTTGAQQQRPESPMITPRSWHAINTGGDQTFQ